MNITLRDIHFSYGRIRALDGVTLDLPQGAIGLLGPNGAGKSTLLRLLLGFLTPDQGEGTVLDYNIRT
ncbi:MAG: ATP-binding cassette domain-containing protein, partial [Candidatus Aminicenantales bacterium]